MKISVRIAIMSHLSDAQEIGVMMSHQNSEKERKATCDCQRHHINFAKYLLLDCDGNLDKEYTDEKLDEIWNKVILL